MERRGWSNAGAIDHRGNDERRRHRDGEAQQQTARPEKIAVSAKFPPARSTMMPASFRPSPVSVTTPTMIPDGGVDGRNRQDADGAAASASHSDAG